MALEISAYRVAGAEEPPAEAWPDATNTGLAGIGVNPTSLPVHGSSFITMSAGQTLQNYRINGTVRVAVANCIIRNCQIDCTGDNWGIDADDSSNLLVEDCTIFGNSSTNACVLDGGGAVGAMWRRLNLSGSLDGAKMSARATIEDCYIHDLSATAESHNDGIQFGTADGITVTHNAIYSRDTSAILMGGGEARTRAINCTIQNNYLNGGGWNFYGPAAPDGGSNVSGGPSQNIQVLNNTFGPDAGYGRVSQWEPGIGNVWSGNVDHLGNPVNP